MDTWYQETVHGMAKCIAPNPKLAYPLLRAEGWVWGRCHLPSKGLTGEQRAERKGREASARFPLLHHHMGMVKGGINADNDLWELNWPLKMKEDNWE